MGWSGISNHTSAPPSRVLVLNQHCEGLTMDFDTVAPNAGAPRRVLVPESTFRRENLRVVLGYPYNHRVRPHTEPVP